jgi:hypothetical protein
MLDLVCTKHTPVYTRQTGTHTHTHTHTHNSIRLKHTAVHTTIEDYGANHCKTPVCTDTLVYTARHTLAALCVVGLLNEDFMGLNLTIANICDCIGAHWMRLCIAQHVWPMAFKHISMCNLIILINLKTHYLMSINYFVKCVTMFLLFIQSAGEKRAIMSTVSFLSDLLERATCCYLRCDVCTIEFGNYGVMEQ